MKYKAIFFDWDDTIGDWIHSAYQAQQDLYEQYRLSEFFDSFEEYFSAYEVHNIELWQQYGLGQITKQFLHRDRFLQPIVNKLGGGAMLYNSPRLIDLADRIGADFLILTNKYFALLPGAAEVVKTLAAHYPLTIISNGFGEVQHYKLEHSGLKPYFRHFIISEEVGINKPQPGIYEEALRRNGVQPEEAVMVGDSYNSDIAGAKAAGIDQIWITQDPGENTATYVVRNIKDILDLFTI